MKKGKKRWLLQSQKVHKIERKLSALFNTRLVVIASSLIF